MYSGYINYQDGERDINGVKCDNYSFRPLAVLPIAGSFLANEKRNKKLNGSQSVGASSAERHLRTSLKNVTITFLIKGCSSRWHYHLGPSSATLFLSPRNPVIRLLLCLVRSFFSMFSVKF